MGQHKSKPFVTTLNSNSWRRLSDSDCLHLLNQPEYFDNQLLNIEQNKLIRRTGSISKLDIDSKSNFDSYNAMSSASLLYRNSMYPGSVKHHQDNSIEENNNVQCKSKQMQVMNSPSIVQTARIRPISMFLYEDDTQKSTESSITNESTLKEIENLNLSLNDLLEQVNTTESFLSTSIRLRRNNNNENEQENKNAEMLQIKEEKSDPEKIGPENGNDFIRCSGLDCMCERCVQNRFKLLNWLLPNCTRINSERLLSGKPDGTFLVRKSEKFPGQYTLSFVCRRAVRHCLIMRSVYGEFCFKLIDTYF